MNGPVPDFYQLVFSQIPDKLKDKIDLEVRSDAYHIVTKVSFYRKGQPDLNYETRLEDITINGRKAAVGIPKQALAWMGLFLT